MKDENIRVLIVFSSISIFSLTLIAVLTVLVTINKKVKNLDTRISQIVSQLEEWGVYED